ncbi:MAG: 5-formyltetrahydrofolate cyclo-ligase [Collinsella sp.]|nr:5-formyltetrahydrofolate cyclo-ligase [Collinsella sp.]
MTAAGEKEGLRRRMLRVRAALGEEARRAADERICAHTCALPAFREADAVFTYLSFGPEVDTRGLIDAACAAGAAVALPRVAGRRALTWHIVRDLEDLVPSSFGMDEPAAASPAASPASFRAPVALVPGLAFDAAGFRLGYGGGFYDAFLAGFPGTAIGLVREAQRVESLGALGALEDHDRPVDLIVSEDGAHPAVRG